MEFVRRNSSLISNFNLAAIALFWITLLIGGSLRPDYSQFANTVSQLSVMGEPYWWLNSLLGIVPLAIATILTGALVLAFHRPGIAAWIAGL